MAVEVLRRGALPSDKTYEATCRNCESLFRFARKDARMQYDQKDGDYLCIACPVCGAAVAVTP